MAALSTYSAAGQQQIVGIASRGTVLGTTEGLVPARRDYDAEVMLGGTAMAVRLDAVRDVVEGGGRGAVAFAGLALRCTISLARRVREVGYGTVEQRLARLMLHFVDTEGLADARGVLIPMPISRTRLAALLGCRLETLVRVLRREDVNEMIAVVKEGILILDVARLTDLADL